MWAWVVYTKSLKQKAGDHDRTNGTRIHVYQLYIRILFSIYMSKPINLDGD